MRRKVAVFADYSGNELISGIMEGIEKVAWENDIDLYYFASFAFWENTDMENIGERAIYNLPKLEDFDGVYILSFSLNSDYLCEKLRREVLETNSKAITLDLNLDGIPGIETDNEIGMYNLTKHLIEVHGVRKVIYLAGFDGDENTQRLGGINKALAEVGERVDEQDVVQCLWSYYKAFDMVSMYLKNHSEVPDAIMAGSDLMAFGACGAIEAFGLKVPDDCIVTGYDRIKSSDEYMPAITTVDRKGKELGMAGMEKLIKIMDGEEVPFREKLDSCMRIAESCGCKHKTLFETKRNEAVKNNFMSSMKRMEFDRQIWKMNRSVRKVATMEDFLDYLKYTVANTVEVTSEKQFICIADEYFTSIGAHEFLDTTLGYDSYTCIYIDKYTQEPTVKKIGRYELLPFDEKASKRPHSYLFTPLHDMEKIYGYAVYIDSIDLVMNGKLISWDGTINQVLGRVHESLKIELMNRQIREALYTDVVSGLYNRTGFNDLAVPKIVENSTNKGLSALVMMDIDRMKLINDRYGHLMGDKAIQTIGKVVKNTLPENWLGIRYGGDEFILTGKCESEAEMLEIELKLQESLSEIIESDKIDFPLTISTGGTIVYPDEVFDIEKCIKLADDTMYEMKKNKKKSLNI
ncbi:MAG: GGDEF domain-containing protein [Lachnospiraceae bacterium]|nr:GGDEF domain-containing protein [Lachnospiraceae bacterium]